jgi:3'-5' exoribonuclease
MREKSGKKVSPKCHDSDILCSGFPQECGSFTAFMTKKIFIQDLTTKEDVNTLFLVKYMALQTDKVGKKYLNVILTDSSGDLEARSWNGAEEIVSRVAKGDFVHAKGKLNMFQGRRQLILGQLDKVSVSEVNPDDYSMKSDHDPSGMFDRLLTIVAGLTDIYIKDLLTQTLMDPDINHRLRTWQAGKSIHHAYQSGLLEHVLSCTELAVHLSAHYKVNVNYVVAGTILHDLCKVHELTDGPNVEYTEEGKLVGHLVKGVEMVEHFSSRIPNFPHDLKMHLKHVLLSHHGEYTYGSPKIPQTSEAFLVHLIDLLDSKMNSMEMVKRTDQQPGNWSGFVKHLDRIVFKAELPFYPAEGATMAVEKSVEEMPKIEVKSGTMGKLLAGYKPG